MEEVWGKFDNPVCTQLPTNQSFDRPIKGHDTSLVNRTLSPFCVMLDGFTRNLESSHVIW